jgi:hypothetical protein
MEAPKCRLCGSRHWGSCEAAQKIAVKPAAPQAAIATKPRQSPAPAPKPPKTTPPKSRANPAKAATSSIPEISTLAPLGQCPHCDARRAYNAERVRLHRERKRNITED